jgi:hypothetical protein
MSFAASHGKIFHCGKKRSIEGIPHFGEKEAVFLGMGGKKIKGWGSYRF